MQPQQWFQTIGNQNLEEQFTENKKKTETMEQETET